MRFSTAALSAALPALALAANFTVDVGLNGLAFTPDTIAAAVGDIVSFVFHPKNHSVTQSTFTAPCQHAIDATTGAAGFDTGFMPIASGASAPVSIKVTVATPLWFFCRQTAPAPHCEQGMVFSINPTADKTQAQYILNAKASTPAPANATTASTAPAAGAAPTTAAGTAPAAGTNGTDAGGDTTDAGSDTTDAGASTAALPSGTSTNISPAPTGTASNTTSGTTAKAAGSGALPRSAAHGLGAATLVAVAALLAL